MNAKKWAGKVDVIAKHASHPGFLSVNWRRSDYSEAGIQPMPMWIPESFDVQVGDEISVTVEFSAALSRVQGGAA